MRKKLPAEKKKLDGKVLVAMWEQSLYIWMVEKMLERIVLDKKLKGSTWLAD